MNLKELVEEKIQYIADYYYAEEDNWEEFKTIQSSEIINKVLDEVKREVEKNKIDIAGKRIWIKEDGLSKSAVKRGTWKSKNYNKAINDISTIIEQLKLK